MSITGTVTSVGNTPQNEVPSPSQPGAVLYTPQVLSPLQRAQVLTNIGGVSVTQSVNYINSVTLDTETGLFVFGSENGAQKFQLPSVNSVSDVSFSEGSLIVKYNNGEEPSVIQLPNTSGNSVKKIGTKLPDIDGFLSLEITDVTELEPILSTKATNNDITLLRGLKVVSDQEKLSMTIVDASDTVLSSYDVSWLANSNTQKTPKSEYIRLSSDDVSAEKIIIKLIQTPVTSDFVFVFVNGIFLNPAGVFVSENILTILKSEVEYEFKAGMKLTVNYKY